MSPKNIASVPAPATGLAAASKLSRRALLGSAAYSYSRILGANERVQVGFIGYGLIGAQHVHDFKNQSDVDIAAFSEVYQPRMEQGVAAAGNRPGIKQYKDFRKLLDDRELQAVVVSTPDHWHALMTMMACAAGKDVYVEKPMTLFAAEGQWMTKVARKHKRIVQVGTQQRSGKHYQHARELIKSGYIGKLVAWRGGSFRNIMPGFGIPEGAQPNDLDYEMWLGPAPKRPYKPHRSLYHFRWFWDYSGGQMTNLAAHELDILQWVLDAKGPRTATSIGGRFALEDDGETPDTQDAMLEYEGLNAVWSCREAAAGPRRLPYGSEFVGTKGTLIMSRAGWEIFPDMKQDPANAIPTFKGHPGGGPQRSGAKPVPYIEAKKEPGSSDEQFDLHVKNFLECIKTRQRPIADVEDGHRTAVACHLSNISLRLGRKIRWDADKEEIAGDREAASMLVRPYRKPWDDVLRGLLA
jgi:predicted dehydrogenase